MRRWWAAASVLVLVGVLAPAVSGASRASCTDARAAVDTYSGGMAKARTAYLKAHKGASARQKFVAAQKAKLAALQKAESAACTVAPTVVPAPTPTANEHFTFTDEIPQWSRDEIEGKLAFAVQDEQTLFGVDLSEVNLFMSGDAAWLAQHQCDFAGRGGDCVASVKAIFAGGTGEQDGPRAIFINWNSSDQSYQATNANAEWIRQKILGHEVCALFRYQLEGPGDDPGPAWLLYGITEMTGYRVASDRGVQPYATSLQTMRTVAKTVPVALQDAQSHDDISRLEQLGADHWFYSAAADRLVADAPNGMRSVGAYLAAVGKGESWQDAFASAFGMSVDAFYADFAAYRKSL